MSVMELGTVFLAQTVLEREVNSARPHAPVVPHRERPVRPIRRARFATAAVLHRAAHRLAPA
jgi:hypothetical protein